MKKLFAMAFATLFLASVPVWAQRGTRTANQAAQMREHRQDLRTKRFKKEKVRQAQKEKQRQNMPEPVVAGPQ